MRRPGLPLFLLFLLAALFPPSPPSFADEEDEELRPIPEEPPAEGTDDPAEPDGEPAGGPIPGLATRPDPPAGLRLPEGVERPDLAGYQTVVFQPGEAEAGLEALKQAKKREGAGPVAVLFAPGRHTILKGDKTLWRSMQGTAERPVYIGPQKPEEPLPVLDANPRMFTSWHVVMQGLVLPSLTIAGDRKQPAGAGVTVEGCWISGLHVRGEEDRPVTATLRRCWVVGTDGNGIYSSRSTGVRIVECVFDFAGKSPTRDHSIYIAHTKGFTIERCILARASSSALKANLCDATTLRDSVIAWCHNWVSCNGNPSEGSPGAQGDGFLAERNVITRMGRRHQAPGAGGMGYFGWSMKNIAVRDNIFIDNARSTAALLFRKPFYNAQFAGPCENVEIRGNVVVDYPGQFLSVQGATRLANMKVTGNIVGAGTNPFHLGENSPLIDEIEFAKNRWPADAAGGPWAARIGGEFGEAVFAHPERDLAGLAASEGYEASDAGFFQMLHERPPHESVEKTLAWFRAAAELKSFTPAD